MLLSKFDQMRKINFQHNILPHLLAVLAFLVITVLFFSPEYFDNKSLSQNDIVQWEASAQELIEYREETGKEGLWTNSIFGGMPAYLISVKWGNNLIKITHAVYTLGLPHPTRIVFAAMLSFYIMLLCFKVRPYVALMGAIAFGLSSYNIIGLTAGHNARISAVSFMPLVMGAIHLAFGKYKWLGGGLAALALAMEIRVNHLQITYYLAFIVGIYLIIQLVEAIQDKKIKPFLGRCTILFAALILAVGSTFGELYSTYEYGKYSNRGKSELSRQSDQEMNQDGLSTTYAFQYSNGMWDPFTLFIPNALGGPGPLPEDGTTAEFLARNGIRGGQLQQYLRAIPTYWGQESATTYYAGAIMIFLMVLGILILDKKYTIWLLLVAVLGILFSYGRNLPGFNYLMFDNFPGYNKFRSVTFTMVMPIFAFALMGCLAIEKILSEKFNKLTQKRLLIALGSTAGLALLLALGAGIFGFRSAFDVQITQQELVDAVISDRKSLFRTDAFRAFALIAAFGVVLYLLLKERVKPLIASSLLVLIASGDVISISNRFISGGNYSNQRSVRLSGPSPADQAILQKIKLGDRVVNMAIPSFYDGRSSQFHHLINGYHGARIRRYQEIIDNGLIAQFQQANNGDFSQLHLLNMLNTKFLITNPSSPSGITENPNALGAAWFVSQLVKVSNPDEEFNNTLELTTPLTTAIVNSTEVSMETSSSNGSIALTDYHPGYWKYSSTNTADGFAVFSEIFYPKGFEVFIDGEPATMTKANYILRGLEIPAGDHIIEFKFAPKIYAIGSPVMMVMSILVLLSFVGGAFISWKQALDNVQ